MAEPTDRLTPCVEWQAAYPAPGTTPPTSGIPQAWLDRLAVVTASPDFPKFGPSQPNNGYPTYPDGLKGADPEVCSFTYECISEEDLVDAPQGVIGVSLRRVRLEGSEGASADKVGRCALQLNFDDGPTPFSDELYTYIEQHNISATHFSKSSI